MTEASGACPSHTSSTSRSTDTTRFAWSSSTPSTARCRGPPSGTARPDLSTSSGPRTPNASGPAWPAASSGAITHPPGHPPSPRPRQRVLTIPPPVRGDSKRPLQAGSKAAPSVTRCPASTHNTQEAIMSTRIPAADLICAPRPSRPPRARVGSPRPWPRSPAPCWHQLPSSRRPPRTNWSGTRPAGPRWHRSRHLPPRSSPWAACPAGRSP